MATGLSSTAANTAVDAVNAVYTWVKLHVGDPGSAGTANPATETTRKQVTWGASAAGIALNTNALTWTSVAGSEDFTHYTIWTLSAAGAFGNSGLITANAVTAGDTFTIAIGGVSVSLTVAS